jgi:hypothetical protein
MRDDFTTKAKDALARRAGMRCANPECRKPTSGPHDEQDRAVNIGVACHIAAASPGGPRYIGAMSTEERRSIDNGIWLCQNCAKLIDSDDSRFSVDTLIQWKRLAEERARSNIEEGYSSTSALPAIGTLVVTAEDPRSGRRHFEEYAHSNAGIIRSVLLPADKVDVLDDATSQTLSEALMNGYDIVQFEAHVEHDGTLILGHEKVSPVALASLMGDRGVRCALFMVCNSANVIGALHASDVPCVIAATGNLYVNYSEEFCRAFYSAISKGFSLTDAFAHANVLSSQALEPFNDLHRAGHLCFSLRSNANEELSLRYRKPKRRRDREKT